MGRAPACSSSEDKEGLKKGAWTAEEDEKLVSFIRKNKGHGSWRTLPKLAGLERCGKSCRLRWTNYLRPNIKRGNFSAEEERIIIQLHGFMGNKWSSIASHLPGRTDNEVKNHWNTHLKKRLTKMGIDPTTHLPLQFATPHTAQDAANYYGLFSQPSFHNNNLDDWRLALLQRSIQVDPAAFVRQLAQWEVARLEAEARLQLAAASSHANLQHYAASNWLQSMQQSQAPGNINVNDLFLQAALNLQMQQAALYSASSSAFPNASAAPLQPSEYCAASDEQQLLMKQAADSWDSQDNQPIASCCKLEDLYGRGAAHASHESGAVYTNTSGMATPETCSSESTSQLLCELPDLLSSTDELIPSVNVVPMSPPSLTDHFDANVAHHDSYWNKMLSLLGHATCTLDA